MTQLVKFTEKHPIRRPLSELANVAAKIQWLTEDEYLALCEVAKHPEHKLLMRLLWETGLRISEALALKYGDIYPDGVMVMHGKGNKQRKVATQAAILGELLRYVRGHEQEHIFQKVRTRSAAWAFMKRYAQEIGLAKRMHPHLFRHSYAINFIRQTGNPWALQSQGGWSNMEIIKVYMRLANEMPAEAVAKMNFPQVEIK